MADTPSSDTPNTLSDSRSLQDGEKDGAVTQNKPSPKAGDNIAKFQNRYFIDLSHEPCSPTKQEYIDFTVRTQSTEIYLNRMLFYVWKHDKHGTGWWNCNLSNNTDQRS